MSKRTRGARRTASGRHAQRARADRRITRPSSPTEVAGRTLEGSAASLSPAAAEEPERAAASQRGATRVRPNSLLALRAAEEYGYVAQDLRRIALVAVLLFGLLIGLWVAIEALGLVKL